MIMLRSSINRETREVLVRNLCREFGSDFPDMLFPGRRDRHRGSLYPMSIMARVLDLGCVHVFLQLVQRFRKQGRDRLLSPEQARQAGFFVPASDQKGLFP